MAYELPELPYSYDALEPYIAERTMSLRGVSTRHVRSTRFRKG
jgi:superoxide dismutase